MSNANDIFNKAMAAEGVTGPLLNLARGIFGQESNGGKYVATSHAGAKGEMQVMPDTFKRMADKGWDINNPEHNIRAGARYIKLLNQRAKGDLWLTATGYYGGEGGLDAARRGEARYDLKNASFPSTFKYADQVVAKAGMPELQRGYAGAKGKGTPKVQTASVGGRGSVQPSEAEENPNYFVDTLNSTLNLLGEAYAKPSEVKVAPAPVVPEQTQEDPWAAFTANAFKTGPVQATPQVMNPIFTEGFAPALEMLLAPNELPSEDGFTGFGGFV